MLAAVPNAPSEAHLFSSNLLKTFSAVTLHSVGLTHLLNVQDKLVSK
jgi:hypothetical protein